MPAYLDHAATTPVRPEVLAAMEPFLVDRFANPSGPHALARDARRALDEAREELAGTLGAHPGEVVFTSGGTEADNLAVLGVHDRRGGALVCPATEHHAVLDPVRTRGGRVVAVDGRGVVDREALAQALDPSVTLVSVMLVNNETGTIQPLAEVAELVRDRAPGAYLHTDAVQALRWLDVAREASVADLVSVSAHKLGGPKGVGALVVRRGVELAPRLLGGGQERGLRAGTQNVAGAVALATAARLAAAERSRTVARVRGLRARLLDGLRSSVPGLVETVPDGVVAGICHLCVPGVESEALLYLLERDGVYASAASSCVSGAMEPSHVLGAMGVDHDLAAGALRLSLGATTTDAEVDHALTVIPAAVDRLRRHSMVSR